MPIIKFVNESNSCSYATEQDVCSLLCYAFDERKTTFQECRYVGCKPFWFPERYLDNPLAIHEFMEFNHKRKYSYQGNLAMHRIVSFKEKKIPPWKIKQAAERIVSLYADAGYIAAYAIHFDTDNRHIHIIIDAISFNDLRVFYWLNCHEAWRINVALNNYYL